MTIQRLTCGSGLLRFARNDGGKTVTNNRHCEEPQATRQSIFASGESGSLHSTRNDGKLKPTPQSPKGVNAPPERCCDKCAKRLVGSLFHARQIERHDGERNQR